MENGSVVVGTLFCEDIYKDEYDDEFPIWKVRLESGESTFLIDFMGWVFDRPVEPSVMTIDERNLRDFGIMPVPKPPKLKR
jgi:hypothetical protein